jgi:hypothetical protein
MFWKKPFYLILPHRAYGEQNENLLYQYNHEALREK